MKYLLLFLFLLPENIHSENVDDASNICEHRPTLCSLLCPFGYLKDVMRQCTCTCAIDPCQTMLCAPSESCIAVGHKGRCIPKFGSHRNECPRLTGGICALRCEKDEDCNGRLICCSNGCGRECVAPIGATSFAIKASAPIVPQDTLPGSFHRLIKAVSNIALNSTPFPPTIRNIANLFVPATLPIRPEVVQTIKVGQCPSPDQGKKTQCETQQKCANDMDCANVDKCCPNACGATCTEPLKATGCIHMVLAISKLPEKRLPDEYVPYCERNGRFSNIQCNLSSCWCVDVHYGTEIEGTRISKALRHTDMCRNPKLCAHKCYNQCAHGYQMDPFGCPFATCQCVDICENVKCANHWERCQLVEPDCANPPCLPVPRCLLNPCKSGAPNRLSNGITALCSSNKDCASPTSTCFRIGYNGLGFCCSGVDASTKEGRCPSKPASLICETGSKCHSDVECPNDEKCCFNGCTLSCTTPEGYSTAVAKSIAANRVMFQPGEIEKYNKGHLTSLVADCSDQVQGNSTCIAECHSDMQCSGMKRCCRQGCSTSCMYPVRSTPCFHLALTAELYSLRTAMKCDRAGNFEQFQCDDEGCFCVDIVTGDPIPGTRVIGRKPNCDSKNPCEPLVCKSECPFGFEKGPNFCPTCKCRNPCEAVKCPQGSVCVMSSVQCYQTTNCQPQPRCVINFCPSGDPYVSQVGNIESCEKDEECPSQTHWCHSMGVSAGGICCPSPSRMRNAGSCPTVPVSLDAKMCKIMCRVDDDCKSYQKCCFDGCGATCKDITTPLIELNKENFEKPGTCISEQQRLLCNRLETNTCEYDSDCAGVAKCCDDGCVKSCQYPLQTSKCLVRKTNLQKMGQLDLIKCRPDGSFEQIQCDQQYCWCVDEEGTIVDGTRTAEDVTPKCPDVKKCEYLECDGPPCQYGRKKNDNGCASCECVDPCDGVACPEDSICIPTSVPCVTKPCPTIPKCVINPCPLSEIVRNSTSLGPKRCAESYDCYDRSMTTHCSMLTQDLGFCCTAEPPKTHSGTCPNVSSITTTIHETCIQGCKSDEDCDIDSKCCWNGCGLTCVTISGVTSSQQQQHHNTQNIHIGECLKVAPLGAFCMQRSSMADCKVDNDCPSLYKCCSDGCVMRCSQPYRAPLCVHQRVTALAMQEISHDEDVYIPECDSSGNFDEIQSHYGLMWCVDTSGKEIIGTKSTKVPDCDQPRQCSSKPCTKTCAYGFNTDNDGCPVCDCISPCEFVDCPAGNVCRLVPVECSRDTSNCLPVAKCIPNMCATGEPFGLEHNLLAGCSPCPAGYYCKNSGYNGISICCPAPEPPQNSLKCPNLQTMLASVDGSSCVVGCRHHSDCPNSSCCFNGCGTSCQFETSPIKPITPSTNRATKKPVLSKLKIERKASQITNVIHSVVTTSTTTTTAPTVIPTKLGTCPNILLNPGCSEQCHQDNDCHGFYKCCTASCGTLCSAPRISTACIHRLIAFESRQSLHPPAVQCTPDGMFRKYQCDVQTNQCWCVDITTGVEEVGTRVFNLGGLGPIDCSIPKLCAVRCESSNCVYGVRLDYNGCPSNGACECNNICQTFQCSPLMECALKKVECTSHPCPDIPICITASQCAIPQRDIYRNPIICENDGGCGKNARCEMGICCQQQKKVQSAVNLMVPVIVATPATVVTSEITSQMMLATNCSTMLSAFDKLVQYGAVIRGSFPKCSPNGNYDRTQCDSKRCWCVDEISGQEIHGTRKTKTKNACKSQSLCFSKCSSTICPYGLLLDSIGCPRAECICKSACENVDCPNGQVCILRRADCGNNDRYCLPVPTCEKSPCNSGMKPLVETRTRQQYSCAQNLVCPSGYYCTAYDGNMQGVCCPGTDSILSIGHNDGLTCPHGDPFSSISDGTPTTCTIESNGCPSTHYCSTQAGQKSGICCVSKRHVCNLRNDSGPCRAKVSRFYYSSKSHSCELFEYGGCAGNLNNFATKLDCDNFCAGIGLDLSSPYDFAATAPVPIESYQIAFSLTGQKIHAANKLEAERQLINILNEKFRIPRGSIEDVQIRDDNSVKFTITDVESRQFARSISEQVSNGKLTMVLSGNTLRAEPHTLLAHQLTDTTMTRGTARVVLYAILLAMSIFLMCVICVFCFSCFCYYRNDAKKRAASPPTTITENRSNRDEMHRVFSRDDVSVCSDFAGGARATISRPEMMRRTDRSQSWIGFT